MDQQKESYENKIIQLRMELEEVYSLQDNAAGGTGVAFSSSVKAITEKKREEDLKRKLLTEIAELKIINEKVIRESVQSETKVRSLLIKNEECLVQIKNSSYQKLCDKFVRVEVLVPTIIEKEVVVTKYVEKVDISAKVELSKKERTELKRSIRAEYNLEF